MGNKRMIRVLHCIHSLSGGGAERQLKLLANISRGVGINSAIFCVNDSGNDIKESSVKIYKSKRDKKFNISIFPSLNKAIMDFKPDIVHAWLPEVVTIPAMLTAYYRKIPSVFSYRNLMYYNRLLSVLEFIICIVTTSRIVSNNPIDNSKYFYRWLFSIKNGVEIHNAVQIDSSFRKNIQRKIVKRSYNMLYVGRITRQKNLECLLMALPLIDSRYNWELSICGDGEERPRLMMLLEKLQLRGKVKLLGYRHDIYSIMQKSDVLIIPSFWEGMPNVLLESMEIGLPVIASNILAHRNIIGESGCALMFDPFSYRDLARVVNRFFDDETIGTNLVLAGWNVVKEYTPERTINKYYDFYSKIH